MEGGRTRSRSASSHTSAVTGSLHNDRSTHQYPLSHNGVQPPSRQQRLRRLPPKYGHGGLNKPGLESSHRSPGSRRTRRQSPENVPIRSPPLISEESLAAVGNLTCVASLGIVPKSPVQLGTRPFDSQPGRIAGGLPSPSSRIPVWSHRGKFSERPNHATERSFLNTTALSGPTTSSAIAVVKWVGNAVERKTGYRFKVSVERVRGSPKGEIFSRYPGSNQSPFNSSMNRVEDIGNQAPTDVPLPHAIDVDADDEGASVLSEPNAGSLHMSERIMNEQQQWRRLRHCRNLNCGCGPGCACGLVDLQSQRNSVSSSQLSTTLVGSSRTGSSARSFGMRSSQRSFMLAFSGSWADQAGHVGDARAAHIDAGVEGHMLEFGEVQSENDTSEPNWSNDPTFPSNRDQFTASNDRTAA